jgi:trans-aconitate methyltransferase
VTVAPATIAEKSFWETEYYWSEAELPCRADMTFSFDRSLARALAAHAPVAGRERVIEIGCAPAKWLIFYAERFAAQVSGIEYSEKGAVLSRENLAAAGVDGEILTCDFFDVDPDDHDLVVSIGFIEHFTDPTQVLARHLDFVAPEGRLAVGVPNFRGLNWMVPRLARSDYLAMHNTAAMRPSLYKSRVSRPRNRPKQTEDRSIERVDPREGSATYRQRRPVYLRGCSRRGAPGAAQARTPQIRPLA